MKNYAANLLNVAQYVLWNDLDLLTILHHKNLKVFKTEDIGITFPALDKKESTVTSSWVKPETFG